MNNICQHLVNNAKKNQNHIAIEYKNKRWHKETWFSYINKIASLTYFFDKNDIKPKTKIAIMADTSYKWAVCDFSILLKQSVSVPIYASNTAQDMAYIINDSEAEVLIIENDEHYNKWQEVKMVCPNIKKVLSFYDLSDDIEDLNSIFQNYKLEKDEIFSYLEEKASLIKLEDLATIVYTSGTTGKPKGVMLKHLQIMSEVEDVCKLASITNEDKSMIFLPLAHILARVEMWVHAYTSHTLAFAESIEKLRNSFLYLKPTFIVGVPRIFEKIYNGVLSQAEASPTRMKIFKWAKTVGRKVSKKLINKKEIPIKLSLEYNLAKKLVFNKLIAKLGGRLRFAISGGAPLSKEIAEFFHGAGLLILEGYGLTETTAGITFNSPFEYRFGTVGKPIGDVKIKINDDGEILVKSNKVMPGYYNQKTEEKIFDDDGWFKTGDIGKLTSDGFLQITDRKKDLIKTAGGKFVAPQKIENKLMDHPYISHVLVHGDRKQYIVCLITLNTTNVIQYLKEKNISYTDEKHLSSNPEVQKIVREIIANLNQELASFETIKKFAILDEDFSIEKGELTPSMKVKRKVCDEKYKEQIDKLYKT